MKIKFTPLEYQDKAVQAVVNCFNGQPYHSGIDYRRDIGKLPQPYLDFDNETGFANTQISSAVNLLTNIQTIQMQNGILKSNKLICDDNGKGKNLTESPLNINIEMETGTGKTYCYIRTIFELNKCYGWSKFIIVVPSIAIREGVAKSLEMMQDHFLEHYGKTARAFIYQSSKLTDLDHFSDNNNINIMIINIQAFNATGKDNRRIYEFLDEFQSRRPIDVIAANRPILILDEPQKMQADKTLQSLAHFKPLFILRYSATHKRQYNLVYRLDALDAYNQKLVKKISVKGIEVNNLTGSYGYLYLESIEISKSAPTARLELEIKGNKGFRREIRKVNHGTDLYVLSKEAEQYKGYVISEINARENYIEFTNGIKLLVGQAVGNIDENAIRTIQIRETINAHLEKEQRLFAQGIKVLSLFFIDSVAKYRLYNDDNEAELGEYAQIFEQEYAVAVQEYLAKHRENPTAYIQYLKDIKTEQTHKGYFSIDKKSKRLVDPTLERSEEKLANDSDAYDLILKDKERLLSFAEPTRFIFSHSALREGWDNPNVFVICTLKHSDNTISRRQEVGRGLRLAVNEKGERMDANYFGSAKGEIHQLNNLTVVTNESYADFVKNLQGEIRESLQSRPTQASQDYFNGKTFSLENGEQKTLTLEEAKSIHKYLVRSGYIDDNDHILPTYEQAKTDGKLAELPQKLKAFQSQIIALIDAVLDPKKLPEMVSNANKQRINPINRENLEKKAFQTLWHKINQKAIYQIEIDREKLIADSIQAIHQTAKERGKLVEILSYTLASGEQSEEISAELLQSQQAFHQPKTERKQAKFNAYSNVKYDLLGVIASETKLTRKTVAEILTQINADIFAQFVQNPEAFIREISRIIKEQLATILLQHLKYSLLEQRYESNQIFIDNGETSDNALEAKNHIWQYVETDSAVEQRFAQELDNAKEIEVFAKLPSKFVIPTPFGDYNPDWAIAFKENQTKHIYFIAETKGNTTADSLRQSEKNKIDSARKFFDALNKISEIKYDVVSTFDDLYRRVMK